jgi:FemAB-related protein (PEP-CTERM system-associated)
MKIRTATETDASRWDEFIKNASSASPYHYFAWKTSVESAYGMKSQYLIAEDDNNNVVGILPAIWVKAPLSQAKLCALPYCDHGEAIANAPHISQALIDHARHIALQQGATFEYRDTALFDDFCNDDHQIDPSIQKVRMLLPLPGSSEVLLKDFKAKLRSQIKKSEKNGLSYKIGNSAELLEHFYTIFTINMRDLGSPTHSKRWFQAIAENFADQCVISVVFHEDKAIGAGLILLAGSNVSIPWASTLRSYNRLAPNMLMYWSLLKYSADQGYDYFDFGRSTVGEGTYKFKAQWGAQPVPLLWSDYKEEQQETLKTSDSSGYLRQLAEDIWRKMPLPLSVIIGSRVRKYISL